MTYDPAFQNTASCRSRITFIDGDKGVLLYRGYPIEQLAEHSGFLDVAYLLLNGELPTGAEHEVWTQQLAAQPGLPDGAKNFMGGFQRDAHSMGIFLSLVGALSTYYPDAKHVDNVGDRLRQIRRLIAQVPIVGAWAYRHHAGLPLVPPDSDLSYTANFLQMLFRKGAKPYKADPILVRALEVLFILHADHEQNCSTNAMRGIGSSQADPYSALAGAAAALYGPLHGGANEAVLRMLQEIGSVEPHPRVHRQGEEGRGPADGLRPPRLQVVRPARPDHQADGRPGVPGHRAQSAAGHRARTRADRARGRVLHQPEAVPQRGLLLRA